MSIQQYFLKETVKIFECKTDFYRLQKIFFPMKKYGMMGSSEQIILLCLMAGYMAKKLLMIT